MVKDKLVRVEVRVERQESQGGGGSSASSTKAEQDRQ